MLRVLDLFSGIGGFSLGLERAGMKTVAFCEIEPFCRKVLKKHWPEVPIYEDVRELTAGRLRDDGISVDVICGGFPCQPVSHAGKRRGNQDDRWLWPEMVRVIGEVQPAWVLCENVVGIITLGLDQVLTDLEGIGYATRTLVIPAGAVGAWQNRPRVWILANAEWNEQPWKEPCHGEAGRVGRKFQPFPWDRDWESALREFRGMDDGLSYGVERIDSIRNAVVPQIPEIIGRAILEVSQ